MLKQGKYILADEPTGRLNAKNREMVSEVLKERNKEGEMIIIVTDDPIVAKQCSQKK